MATYGETMELQQVNNRRVGGEKSVQINTMENTGDVPTKEKDAGRLNSVLGVRKLFSGAQIFAFSLTYMATWETSSS